MHTDESWFLEFERMSGRKHAAHITTTNGGVIASVNAPDAHFMRQAGQAGIGLRASFESNVRMMAAGQAMFSAMGPLLDAALKLGLPKDHPAVFMAKAALDLAQPKIFAVTLDGALRFTGTQTECFQHVLRSQGQSFDYAVKYGGWAVSPWQENEPTSTWRDDVSGFVYRAFPSVFGPHEIDGVSHRVVGVVPKADGSLDESRVWDVTGDPEQDEEFDQRALVGLGVIAAPASTSSPRP